MAERNLLFRAENSSMCCYVLDSDNNKVIAEMTTLEALEDFEVALLLEGLPLKTVAMFSDLAVNYFRSRGH